LIRLFRHIPVLTLWLAALGLIAHLMIPHDHHSEYSCLPHEDTCPTEADHKDHHAGYPIHCHAFNNVAVVKATPINLAKLVPSSLPGLAGDFTILRVFLSESDWCFAELSTPFPDYGYSPTPTLRGPPSVL
jgi:hypothetical protein